MQTMRMPKADKWLSPLKMGEAFTAPKVTTSPADLTLSYTSSNTKVATVDSSTGAVTLVSAGETTITASFAGNDNYNAASDNYTLTVAKADAVSSDLSFASETATATFGDATLTSPELTNPHQLPLTWNSSNEGVATVDASGVVTIVGAGETVISAAFAGDEGLPLVRWVKPLLLLRLLLPLQI